MKLSNFDVDRSWATAPLWYRAPHPGRKDKIPRPYQFAGVEYALSRKHSIIGDPPGLGKTCEAILISNAIEAKSTLVVCPASLRLNWEKEIWLWSTLPNVRTYPVLQSKDGVHLQTNYLIISYDLLRNKYILAAILSKTWDHMILDECHLLKDPKGNKRTQAICKPDALPSVVGRITMLSGTLLPNQPIEVYNSCRLLNWDSIDRMSLAQFREYYYGLGEGMIMGPVVDPVTKVRKFKLHHSYEVRNVPRNTDELRHRLRSSLMVRRLRKDVLPDLPEASWHLFPLQSNSDIKGALKHEGWAQARALHEMNPGEFDRNVPIDGPIATARRLLGEAKVGPVCDYIDELFHSGITKLVVSAWHHTVLEVLYERLKKYGIVYMDGRTSTRKKQEAEDHFLQYPETGVILGQMIPLGMGWNLQVAQDVVNVEPSWVPGQNEQILDRVVRMTQEGDYVLGHIPVLPGTLEERIIASAIEKDKTIHATLDGRG